MLSLIKMRWAWAIYINSFVISSDKGHLVFNYVSKDFTYAINFGIWNSFLTASYTSEIISPIWSLIQCQNLKRKVTLEAFLKTFYHKIGILKQGNISLRFPVLGGLLIFRLNFRNHFLAVFGSSSFVRLYPLLFLFN